LWNAIIETVNAICTTTGIQRVSASTTRKAVAFRGTASQVAMAEQFDLGAKHPAPWWFKRE
jgi:hypothetical protein